MFAQMDLCIHAELRAFALIDWSVDALGLGGGIDKSTGMIDKGIVGERNGDLGT